ncbi:sigma-54-dependent Fis family transcriptional regulator [Geobacter sulfurreducens]|jgi:DNA-binding NtrC family response regulator|uniref:sigma-54-dependent transcriptional regulator n=1 Tax=Geobacter sulfurreducens TaxID=35554 RepID=UPI0001D8F385|nr:sigma-54 dependent transcriptional regulator [Geobacter sulfurreducens]ADI83132.1 flagellar biogenesis master sigma-54-dependent transcriptional response regulator [Geobacter sulfurreducens KN400]AJY70025.1 Fis family transcriptional regulator [Geobacter sulfurreducens]QVW35563.1 sigma-54-dependent Fis family transcriptional regulator [Geobacter sulfurreducens]UTG93002.1 sigma-54-dependent Fis family transcriptional regulator [Geobacter sulfurreducens]
METPRLLIADDDKKTRDFVAAFLKYKGYDVVQAFDGQDALEKLEVEDVHLVITDLMMPRVNGLEFVKKLKAMRPGTVVIAYSAFGNYEMTSNLLKAGVFFYLEKPFNLDELETHVKRGLEHQSLQSQTYRSKPALKSRSLIPNIIGESPRMLSLFELIEKVAESDSTVLIQGESGTGKELVARAVHDLSNRKNRNFVPVNCAAIPDELLESELFGHVKGSFTGAIATRIGRFEMADKGTLFLDEIGDMKPNLQVKLLRVLQNRELEPVGATRSKKVDVRIIAATNQNLEKLVASKQFREDLFYRISVIPIFIPPLRDRREDIPLLVNTFLDRFNRNKKSKVKGIDADAMEILCGYDWPGNVRELENLVERLVILKGFGTLGVKDLPEKYTGVSLSAPSETLALPDAGICLNTVVEEFENNLILQALKKTGGNKKEAALLLNLKRTTLIEKLKKRKLDVISTSLA